MPQRPRVDAELMNEYSGQTVTVIGKVDSADQNQAVLTLNTGNITLQTHGYVSLEIGAVYEIVGKVLSANEVKVYKASKLNTTDLPPADLEKRLLALREGPAKKQIFTRE